MTFLKNMTMNIIKRLADAPAVRPYLFVLLMLAALCRVAATVEGQTTTIATVTVTNAANTNYYISINGQVRIFTNPVTAYNTQIQVDTNQTIGGTASNLYNAYIGVQQPQVTVSIPMYLTNFLVTNGVQVFTNTNYVSSTNEVQFMSIAGTPAVVTFGSNWATVSYSGPAPTPTNAYAVRVPVSAVGATDQSNAQIGIVNYLNLTGNSAPVVNPSNPIWSEFAASTNLPGLLPTLSQSNLPAQYLTSIANSNGGYGNMFLGNAGTTNTGQGENFAAGVDAFNGNVDGFDDIVIGYQAAQIVHHADSMIAIGSQSLQSLGTNLGSQVSGNLAIGYQAGQDLIVGGLNVIFGNAAYNNATQGSNNIAIGYAAGTSLTTGNSNIDIGNVGSGNDNGIIRLGTGQSNAYIAGALNANLSASTNYPIIAGTPNVTVTQLTNGTSIAVTGGGSGGSTTLAATNSTNALTAITLSTNGSTGLVTVSNNPSGIDSADILSPSSTFICPVNLGVGDFIFSGQSNTVTNFYTSTNYPSLYFTGIFNGRLNAIGGFSSGNNSAMWFDEILNGNGSSISMVSTNMTASNAYDVIVNGLSQSVSGSAYYSTIDAGTGNSITATAGSTPTILNSVIPGGYGNTISNLSGNTVSNSMAWGNAATVTNSDATLVNDSTTAHSSSQDNRFDVYADNGVYFNGQRFTNGGASYLTITGLGAGTVYQVTLGAGETFFTNGVAITNSSFFITTQPGESVYIQGPQGSTTGSSVVSTFASPNLIPPGASFGGGTYGTYGYGQFLAVGKTYVLYMNPPQAIYNYNNNLCACAGYYLQFTSTSDTNNSDNYLFQNGGGSAVSGYLIQIYGTGGNLIAGGSFPGAIVAPPVSMTANNLVLNTLFTNGSGYFEQVSGDVSNVTAAVSGEAGVNILVTGIGGVTNHGPAIYTSSTSLAQTNIGHFTFVVTNGGTFLITNVSTGGGDATTLDTNSIQTITIP